MKTLRSKDLLAWIILLIASILFGFTISFAQPTKENNNVLHSTRGGSDNRINFPPAIPMPNPPPPHPIPPYIPPPIDTATTPKNNDRSSIEGETKTQLAGESEMALNPNDVKAYPNPSDGKFTLTIQPALSGSLAVSIADITGKEIYAQNIDNFTGYYSNQIDLSNKGRGIYILSIAQNNAQVTKRIIIN